MKFVRVAAALLAFGLGAGACGGEDDPGSSDPLSLAESDIRLGIEGELSTLWDRFHPDVQASSTRVAYLDCASQDQNTSGEEIEVEAKAERQEAGFTEVEVELTAPSDGSSLTMYVYYGAVDGELRIADILPNDPDGGCVEGLLPDS